MSPEQKHRIVYALAAGLVLSACRGEAHRAAAVPASESPPVAAPQATPTYGVVVVHEWPHDATAFTEGLEWHAGFLYEGTGIVGRSRVQRTDLASGVVSQHADVAPPYFGEGITIFGGTLYELTWHGGVVFTYDARTLRRRGQLPYAGECWGLTHDDHSLIMSDGTSVLRYLDPVTLRSQRTLEVTAGGEPVSRLNELELIDGQIWANIWQTPLIARIDPATGVVAAWVDLAPLVPHMLSGDTVDVTNGIAYDSSAHRIFVTGKLWPMIYEIRLGSPE